MPGMSSVLWKHTGWGPATYDESWDPEELKAYQELKKQGIDPGPNDHREYLKNKRERGSRE